MTRRILVTSALPYANGPLHFGHVIEAVQTDVWVRYQRLRGHEAYYCCADDTHGTPVMLKAEQEGVTPEQLIGVTMPESGVSRVVAVDIDEALRIREELAA